MPYRPYPHRDRALGNLRRQQTAYLSSLAPAGGWSAAAVRPGLDAVARRKATSRAAWSPAVEQTMRVMATAGLRTHALYDPATEQFHHWTEPST